MFLEIIVLLLLVIAIVSPLLLARFIWSNTRKDRELHRVRDEKAIHQTRRVEQAAVQVFNAERLLKAQLFDLDEKTNELYEVVESNLQLFVELARSDLLASRREELSRTKELKVALERLVGVNTLSRQPPAPNDLIAIDSLISRIEELEAILNGGTYSESH